MSAADPGLPQDGPNPLEIFFEKNKKWIYTLAVILVATLAGNYGLEKLARAKKNQEWHGFTAATGLATKFSETVALSEMSGMEQFRRQIWSHQLMGKQRELITKVMDDVRGADQSKLDGLIATCDDDPDRLPWLLWVAANKCYAEGDWQGCRDRCAELKKRFGEHVLTATSQYPIQVRPEKEDPEAKKKAKKKKKDAPTKKPKKPELEPAVAGSPVDNLLAAVAKDEAFRKANPHLFEAPKPDESETAVFTLSGVDLTSNVEIEIGFFPKAAPKHVAAFKKSVTDGYYVGMRIHKIKRKPKESSFANDGISTPTTVHLGHPNSKQDDRDKWKEEVKAEDEDIFEFEAGMKNLSFFPLMVAAEQEKDGKSSARRFFIAVNDCAAEFDGEYVILGRVIRGGEHITQIAAGDLSDVAEENAGEGIPGDELKVEKTELKKK